MSNLFLTAQVAKDEPQIFTIGFVGKNDSKSINRLGNKLTIASPTPPSKLEIR